jgi:hypothetical protein
MKLIPNQESKYGKFDLVPDEGQKLSHFIDLESKLLIVSESPIDISNIPLQHGVRIVPSKKIIVEPKEQKILNFEQWKKYFSYEPIETISGDKKLKEIWIRKHDKEQNTDSYEGYLIEIESGKKLIDKAKSIAFNDNKRRSLIKWYYQSIERRKKSLKSLEKGKYPIEKHEEYLNGLLENEIVFQFTKENTIYQLKKDNQSFSLYNGEVPSRREDYNNLILKNKQEDYKSIDEFWNQFSSNEKWFQEIKASKINRVMEKFIITSHNQILVRSEISYKEHERLHTWMNRCFNKEIERNTYWQFCSNCRERVFYNPRYPKHACRNCVNLIKDEFGNQLDYQNTHELFGSRFRLKSNQKEVKIFIDKNEYWVEEARFGGIVHRKKEKN